jgi:hypothetical protein
VFIDEAGVNLGMVRLYARALKGKRAQGTRPHQRGKNVSMVSAITLKEVLTFFNSHLAPVQMLWLPSGSLG